MSFVFIPETKKKCRIGEGCLNAVVSNTGHLMTTVGLEDDYGTDFELKKLVNLNGQLISHQIFFGIQLKTTSNWKVEDDFIVYDLEVSAYNNMIYHNQHGTTKLIIVLMCLHENSQSWCKIDQDSIRFQNSLFWYHTDSTTLSSNTGTKRIKVPVLNIFNQTAIDNLIKRFEIRLDGE